MSASSFDQLVVFLSRLTKQHGAPPELKQTIAGGQRFVSGRGCTRGFARDFSYVTTS